MKNFKYILFALLMTVVTVGLTACSSDDDSNGGGNSIEGAYKSGKLIGTWQVIKIKGSVLESGEKHFYSEDLSALSTGIKKGIIFYSNFYFHEIDCYPNEKWSLNGNGGKFTLDGNMRLSDVEYYKIVSLRGDRMVLHYYFDQYDDKRTKVIEYDMTCKKISDEPLVSLGYYDE